MQAALAWSGFWTCSGAIQRYVASTSLVGAVPRISADGKHDSLSCAGDPATRDTVRVHGRRCTGQQDGGAAQLAVHDARTVERLHRRRDLPGPLERHVVRRNPTATLSNAQHGGASHMGRLRCRNWYSEPCSARSSTSATSLNGR